MKDLQGTARTVAAAPLEACLALLEAVDGYPAWYPSVVHAVEVLDRDGRGVATRARATLQVSLGALVRNFNLLLAVDVQRPSTVKLTKVSDHQSEQRFDVIWNLRDQGGAGTSIELALRASLDVPRFIPVGSIGDSLARGFVTAARDKLTAVKH
jgi:ribosome-associated toxin RatA of RatAB toxin-antitoxin module